MDDLARLPAGDRADAFTASARARGIGAALLEKDFWVCWTLRRVYALEGLPTSILFKGGTSLSKVFKAIERFSEDIDLSLDRAGFGFADERDPAAAPSRKQRDKRLEQLSESCRTFIRETLMPRLASSFSSALQTAGDWRLEVAPDDAQTLLFFYPLAVQTSAWLPNACQVSELFGFRAFVASTRMPLWGKLGVFKASNLFLSKEAALCSPNPHPNATSKLFKRHNWS